MDDSFDQDVSEMCVSITEENLKVAAAKWILKNREGHRIPNSVMESIVSGAKFLYEAALSQIQQQVVDKMKEAGVTPDAIMSVSSVFDGETQYTNVFRGLETTYRQNSFIKDHFRFVVCLLSSTCTTQYQCFYNMYVGTCSNILGYPFTTRQISQGW